MLRNYTVLEGIRKETLQASTGRKNKVSQKTTEAVFSEPQSCFQQPGSQFALGPGSLPPRVAESRKCVPYFLIRFSVTCCKLGLLPRRRMFRMNSGARGNGRPKKSFLSRAKLFTFQRANSLEESKRSGISHCILEQEAYSPQSVMFFLHGNLLICSQPTALQVEASTA